MKHTYISYNVFKLIFDDAMKEKQVPFYDGERLITPPVIAMRNQETGWTSYFNNLDEAYELFKKEHDMLRVMDVNGGIYLDNYGDSG